MTFWEWLDKHGEGFFWFCLLIGPMILTFLYRTIAMLLNKKVEPEESSFDD